MSKPISVGDLVMVVRTRCCTTYLGVVFRVSIIDTEPGIVDCECGQSFPPETTYENDRYSFLVDELKRLDPDALKDDVPTKEELTA